MGHCQSANHRVKSMVEQLTHYDILLVKAIDEEKLFVIVVKYVNRSSPVVNSIINEVFVRFTKD